MEKNTKSNNNFGLKKSKLSILPIVFSTILAAGALAGTGVSIWQVAKNYTESSEFTKTVNGRIKIDPFAVYTGDKTEKEAQEITNDCAQKLSNWLRDKGQQHYDVTSECYKSSEASDTFDCYLNAQFEINKVTNKDPYSKEQAETKIDDDPYLSFFGENAFNSNEKTFVYRWYTTEPNQKPEYTVIPFRQIFHLPSEVGKEESRAKTLVNEDGQNGVVLQVEDKSVLTDIYKDLAKAKEDSKKKVNADIDKWNQPRLYIVNDMQGMFDEVNYHISNWWVNQNSTDKYLKWYSGSNQQAFSKKYKEKNYKGEDRSHGEQNNYFKLNTVKDHKTTEDLENLDLFNYIDQSTPGTVDVGQDFISHHINKIVTMDNFTSFMPEKITDTYKNKIDSGSEEIINFWYSASTKTDAEAYLNNQIKYGFNKGSIAGLTFSTTKTGDDGAADVFNQITTADLQTKIIPPTYTESLFGGNNLVGTLSLGFLIFLIVLLIILAALYRTTGVMSWICMMFALSMTGLIATIGSTVISMSLLFGLFAISIAGFLACLAICGRMRRRLLSNEDTHVMVNKTFKRSLLPIVDISVLTLIFGVCFTYIAPIALNAFGLVLIIGAFAIFISIYLLNGLLHGLFFNNNLMITKYQFFGKPSNIAHDALTQRDNAVPASLDATKLEIPYYSSMSKKKIDTTNMKALIAVCVVAALLIAGIIYFSVSGFVSSSMFHTSTCIAIKFDGNLLVQPWFTGLEYVSMKHYENWWYFYTNMPNAAQVAQSIATGGGLQFGSSVLAQTIFGSTNQDILNATLLSIIISTLIGSVYAAIRHNWISFVPCLAGMFCMPLLILGISSMCQIKFDQLVVIGFALASIVNTIYTINSIGSINESWSRREAFTNDELKYVLNTSLKNQWRFIWVSCLVYALFILAFGVSAPTGISTSQTIGLLVISMIVTIVFVPFVTSFLLYQFMKVRNFALSKKAIKTHNKVLVNYDDIDEQGIEGINKFTKKIPVNEPKSQGENND